MSVRNVTEIIRQACADYMGRVMAFDREPKVWIDLNHAAQSCIFAPDQTRVVGGRRVRVLAWYDTEWRFSRVWPMWPARWVPHQ